jgi:hypothetical protein
MGQQQNLITQAAERFAEAERDSYQTVADRAASAQRLNAELTQQFFNGYSSSRRRPLVPT